MAPRKMTAPESNGKIVVDMNQLTERKMTGREIRDFERVQPVKAMNLTRVLQTGEIPYDTLLGLIWILHRRNDPSFTFDNALDMTDDDWEIIGATADEADPTAEPVETTTGS